MYAALVEGLPPEERARLDEELVLPFGASRDDMERRRKAYIAGNGWQ